MHSSRIRTARAMTGRISWGGAYHAHLPLPHACQPFATHAPLRHTPSLHHTCPPSPCMPPPGATTHTPPGSNHAHPPGATMNPLSNHACPPHGQTDICKNITLANFFCGLLQECILVECVLPASMVISTGEGVFAQGGGICPGGRVCPGVGGVCWGCVSWGVYTPRPKGRHPWGKHPTFPLHAGIHTPVHCMLGYTPPLWTEWRTGVKNITLSRTLFAGSKNYLIDNGWLD